MGKSELTKKEDIMFEFVAKKEFVNPISHKLMRPGARYITGPYLSAGWREYYESLEKHGFIEEIKDEPWKPKVGEKYWYLDSAGNAVCDTIVQMVGDEFTSHLEMVRRKDEIGNRFETAEQTQRANEWLKAFKVLRGDTKGFKPKWRDKRQDKWYVFYDYYAECLSHGWQNSESAHLIYFAEEADVIESIKKHPNEWKTFLGVEEEE